MKSRVREKKGRMKELAAAKLARRFVIQMRVDDKSAG